MSIDCYLYDEQEDDNKTGVHNNILCKTRINSKKDNECGWMHTFQIPFNQRIECLMDICVQIYIEVVHRLVYSCKLGIPAFEEISESNPETAWMFYKRTLDKVIKGEEFFSRTSFMAEMEGELNNGNTITARYSLPGANELSVDGRVIGKFCEYTSDEISGVVINDSYGADFELYNIVSFCGLIEEIEFAAEKLLEKYGG